MTNDQLSTEVQRQDKYLSALPEDFQFPLFNARTAVESQRRSGYRDTAAAGREIIDNAVEAGASRVHVVFDTAKVSGKASVKSVAFIDDGAGMRSKMIRYALTWGGGTHFDDHQFIGRFGFGLPNSSINQTRRVEVYSRTSPDWPWMMGELDITNIAQHGLQTIPEPTEAELPGFVQTYLDKQNWTLDHGTVVVWRDADRLSYKRAANLRELLLDDFGVVYRYLLRNRMLKPDGLEIVVEGKEVDPVDPLFLTPGARLYLPEEDGGAQIADQRSVVVRYYRDPDTGEGRLARLQTTEEIDAAVAAGDTVGTIQLTVARFQRAFVLGEKQFAATDAYARFEIRKNRRGMSFVRAGREIQTLDVFPKSDKEKGSGLGSWPLLQAYAYHWGIEVKFTPELDDVFGITNDKQGVRPIEDFWRVLVQEEVDSIARRENLRQRKEDNAPPDITPSPSPSPAEVAARNADVGVDERPKVPPRSLDDATKNLEKKASENAGSPGEQGDLDTARKALEEEARRRPYRVDYASRPNGPIFEPRWEGTQMVVEINKQHQFFQVLYGDLKNLPGGARCKEAIELVVVALARAELRVDEEEYAVFAAQQRRFAVSPWLNGALGDLAARMKGPEREIQPDEEDPAATDSAA